ncbi:MAG: hypothetical protein R3Y58_07935 [Eubacteriales bacterium]
MNKGDIGYWNNLKKREWIKCSVQWAAVVTFLAIGIITTNTKLNLFTLFAILSCLPASKTMVGVIVKYPIKPMKNEQIEAVKTHTTHLTTSYDVVITSKEKIMPIECVVISGNSIYGYTTNKKVGLESTAAYIKTFLAQNDCGRVNIKLFHEYVPFLSRVEGLNNIASIEKADTKDLEEKIKYTIKLYSM